MKKDSAAVQINELKQEVKRLHDEAIAIGKEIERIEDTPLYMDRFKTSITLFPLKRYFAYKRLIKKVRELSIKLLDKNREYQKMNDWLEVAIHYELVYNARKKMESK